MPSPGERREAAIEAARKQLPTAWRREGTVDNGIAITEAMLAAYDAALKGEAEGLREAVKMALRCPLTCGTCHADLKRALSEHPQQSVEPGEKESNTTTSAEHPGPRTSLLDEPAAKPYPTPSDRVGHPETGERETVLRQRLEGFRLLAHVVGTGDPDTTAPEYARGYVNGHARGWAEAHPHQDVEPGFNLRAILEQALEGLESAHPEDYVENLREVIAALASSPELATTCKQDLSPDEGGEQNG